MFSWYYFGMKRFLLAFLIVIVAALALVGLVRLSASRNGGTLQPTLQPSSSPTTQSPMASPTLETGVGYTLLLPTEFESESMGTYSRLYKKKSTSGSEDIKTFAYVSVIPNSSSTASGEIYNYSKADVDALRRLPLNESVVLGAKNLPTAQYFTYTHVSDTMIGGYGAKVFRNTSPWEFPVGTEEYRYLLEFGNVTYLLGGYVGTQSAASLQKSDLDQLFSTFSVKPESIQAINSPVPTGSFKIYSNTQAGVSLSYPTGWPLVEDTTQFQDGDLFSLRVRGQTTRPQSELSDGIVFSVMKPQPITQDLRSWMQGRYRAEPGGDSKEPEYSTVSFAGKTYQKVIVCGMGCFTYYHIVNNNRVYGFLVFAVGPHEATYVSTASKILSSVTFLE